MIITLLNLELSYFILRTTLGVFFLIHGYRKLFCDFSGTKDYLRGLCFRPAWFWAGIIGGAEFLGGIFMLVGLQTQLTAGVLTCVLLIELAKMKFGKDKFIGGWELELLAFGMALALVFGLPGGVFPGSF